VHNYCGFTNDWWEWVLINDWRIIVTGWAIITNGSGRTTAWAWTTGGGIISELRVRSFGEVGFDDVVGREDGVKIDGRRPDHEGESGLERRGVGKARPFNGIAHIAVGRNGDDLAGLVVQDAFAPHIADLDGAFDEQ